MSMCILSDSAVSAVASTSPFSTRNILMDYTIKPVPVSPKLTE